MKTCLTILGLAFLAIGTHSERRKFDGSNQRKWIRPSGNWEFNTEDKDSNTPKQTPLVPTTSPKLVETTPKQTPAPATSPKLIETNGVNTWTWSTDDNHTPKKTPVPTTTLKPKDLNEDEPWVWPTDDNNSKPPTPIIGRVNPPLETWVWGKYDNSDNQHPPESNTRPVLQSNSNQIIKSSTDKNIPKPWEFHPKPSDVARNPGNGNRNTAYSTEKNNIYMIHGIFDNNIPNENSIDRIQKDLNDTTPCDTPVPPKPTSFSAPGKRIAQEKCDEYKWEGEMKKKINDECKAYKLEHNISDPQIVGGFPAKKGEYRHMGAIGWRTVEGDANYPYIFMCGGSLISSNFVLTAAHCTWTNDASLADPKPEIVRFGHINIKNSKKKYQHDVRILKILKHPGKYAAKYNDIALIKLVKSLSFDVHIHPACLWLNFDTKPLGDKAYITGWGHIVFGRNPSDHLLAAEVDILDKEECQHYNGSPLMCAGVLDTQICAGGKGTDTCQGDSGGPLQVRIPTTEEISVHYVIGVTSFGIGCGSTSKNQAYGLYTRVSEYIDWIEDCVWGNDDTCNHNNVKHAEKICR